MVEITKPNGNNSDPIITNEITSDHPLYLHQNDHPWLLLISIKLNGSDNYSSWKRSIMIALNAKNKMKIINGKFPEPNLDSAIRAFNLNFIHSASKLWLELQELYAQIDGHRIYQLSNDIVQLKQADCTIEVYYHKIKGLWDSLMHLRLHMCVYVPVVVKMGRKMVKGIRRRGIIGQHTVKVSHLKGETTTKGNHIREGTNLEKDQSKRFALDTLCDGLYLLPASPKHSKCSATTQTSQSLLWHSTTGHSSFPMAKARLVTNGFTQKEGIDFKETFAPVAKMVTIKAVIALAVYNNWLLKQLDVNNAFFYGDLHKEVYMQVPQELLQHAGLLDDKPTIIPLNPTKQLNDTDGDLLPDQSTYRTLVGKLIYRTITRHDLSFAAQLLSWFSKQPRTTHMKALLKDLKVTILIPMPILCDNESTITLASNPVQHARTKHIELDCHFVRENIKSNYILPSYISTRYQGADVLTKGLP
nr:cysteine-rich RLK (receptor-like protein kinase) 8 [Tanacetum cinerariifolium]